MSDLKSRLKERIRAMGGDLGVGNIERFADAPQMMHPKNIFPDCKSVISIVAPIPRGSYRGITEGTHWPNYTFYSYNRLNTLFRPLLTYEAACMIEDEGWEAVPIYPGVPERAGICQSVAPDRPPPEINLNVRILAMGCGLGEMGWSKVFIHPKWGPRVRIGTILTDLDLEPDPLIEPGTLCNRCMRCVRQCPGGAIPKPAERESIRIRLGDTTYEWGDVHMGRCTLTHHGLNETASPFMKKHFPGVDLNVRESPMSEETAYKMTYTLALGHWHPSLEHPSESVSPYYKQILDQTGYFAVCGARGCIRACMDVQEKCKRIEQHSFHTKVWEREDWTLPHGRTDETGGIAEGKGPEKFLAPDTAAGSWA